jgi:hypothetical protein
MDGDWINAPGFLCDCKEYMSLEEGERRLNATEMLSAELAYTLAMEDTMPEGSTGGDALKAYAAALEGRYAS